MTLRKNEKINKVRFLNDLDRTQSTHVNETSITPNDVKKNQTQIDSKNKNP